MRKVIAIAASLSTIGKFKADVTIAKEVPREVRASDRLFFAAALSAFDFTFLANLVL